MSYRGLGLLMRMPALHGLGEAAVRDTSGLVPRECQGVATYTMPPDNIAAGQVLVQVFPFVRSAPEKMPAVLAQILGTGGQGGTVLRQQVERGTNYQFAGGGWIADAVSQPSTTRGYLWLALAPAQNTTSGQLRQEMKLLLAAALRAENLPVYAAGTPSSTASASTVDLNTTWGAVATGESDDQLREAVYRAMAGAAGFGSFVRFVGGAARAAAAGGRLSGAFQNEASRMAGAVNAVQGVAAIEIAVRAQIAAALTMGTDQQPAAAAALNQAKLAVETPIALIQGAVVAAPTFIQVAATQRDQVLLEVRTAILNSVETDIQRGSPFEPARETFRCAMLNESKQQVERQLATTDAAITQAAGAAQWLLNNSPAITDAMERLEKLRGEVDKAFEQLPLGFWLRNRWGIPTWGWGVVGAGVFVAGAFGVRALRKRSKRAS